jgi:hypothetical protein
MLLKSIQQTLQMTMDAIILCNANKRLAWCGSCLPLFSEVGFLVVFFGYNAKENR